MFPVLFLIPRAAGWLAHWAEQQREQDKQMYRPDLVRQPRAGWIMH